MIHDGELLVGEVFVLYLAAVKQSDEPLDFVI